VKDQFLPEVVVALKADFPVVELSNTGDEVFKRSTKPIQLPDDSPAMSCMVSSACSVS
jgi:hypothetical protein